MRTSLSMRAVAASVAVTLFFSLRFEAALARAQASFRSPVMRPGIAYSHGPARAWRNGRQYSWTWRGQNRQNRWSRNGWLWNQAGFYGSGFWYSPYGFADAASGAGGAPLVVVGAPALNVFPAAMAGSADPNAE